LQRARGTTPQKTTYYSTTEWEKLSYEERDRVRKERDKKGEQGGSKRTISEMTTKQLASAIISSIKAAALSDSGTCDDDKSETPKKSNAGNSFGGRRESAKRSKSDRLEIAAYRSSHRKPLPPHQLSISALTQLTQRAAKCELDSLTLIPVLLAVILYLFTLQDVPAMSSHTTQVLTNQNEISLLFAERQHLLANKAERPSV